MTENINGHQYIYDPSEFLTFLAENYGDRTVREYKTSINKVLNGLSSVGHAVPLGDITSSMVLDSLSGTGLKDSTIHLHATRFGKYLGYMTGKNPIDEIHPSKAIPYVRDGHLLYDYPFQEDSELFKHQLETSGYHPKDIDPLISHVEIAIRLLMRDRGYFDIEDLNIGDYQSLIPLTAYMNHTYRQKTLQSFGMYCCYKFGENPYERPERPKTPEKPYPYAEEVEHYGEWMRREGFRSVDDKLTSLKSALRRFRECVGEKPLSEITEADMREYRRSMYLDLRSSTARHQFLLVKGLIQFSTGRDVCRGYTYTFGRNPPMRTYITQDQFKKIWNEADITERTILSLAGCMGLRRAEIIRIRMPDIEGGKLTIYGKGHGTRGLVKRMDIPHRVMEVLDLYIEERQRMLALHGDRSNGHMMVRRSGKIGQPMNERTINEVLNGLSERTGVEFTTHTLRRFYASLLYSSGLTEEAIAEYMRHSRFTTTSDYYLFPNNMEIQEAMEKVCADLHPEGSE